MIGIIDYRAGNSNSVKNACDRIGVVNRLISTEEQLEKVDAVILPGVGSARETMNSLRELNLIEGLERRILEDKIPYLGICVGMQILFEFSEEGNVHCLGWLKGKVKRFNDKLVRIPQMGWNDIRWEKCSFLRRGAEENAFFYFVNSYHVIPSDKQDILATTVYGYRFASMIEHENIYATQFHVEKSGKTGLRVLENFAIQKGGN